jgi:HAD superfamily phosphoserine phosphatase-like hydrolase
MVKADRREQLDVIFHSDRVKIRPGLQELVAYCKDKGHRFVIVSNGLIFYIQALLESLGLNDIEVFAARNEFHPEGMKVSYISPEGEELDAGFKEAYTRLLRQEGYDVAYLGNGVSDIFSSRMAVKVFATGDLLRKCEEENLECIPFNDLFDVIHGLEEIQ